MFRKTLPAFLAIIVCVLSFNTATAQDGRIYLVGGNLASQPDYLIVEKQGTIAAVQQGFLNPADMVYALQNDLGSFPQNYMIIFLDGTRVQLNSSNTSKLVDEVNKVSSPELRDRLDGANVLSQLNVARTRNPNFTRVIVQGRVIGDVSTLSEELRISALNLGDLRKATRSFDAEQVLRIGLAINGVSDRALNSRLFDRKIQ